MKVIALPFCCRHTVHRRTARYQSTPHHLDQYCSNNSIRKEREKISVISRNRLNCIFNMQLITYNTMIKTAFGDYKSSAPVLNINLFLLVQNQHLHVSVTKASLPSDQQTNS